MKSKYLKLLAGLTIILSLVLFSGCKDSVKDEPGITTTSGSNTGGSNTVNTETVTTLTLTMPDTGTDPTPTVSSRTAGHGGFIYNGATYLQIKDISTGIPYLIRLVDGVLDTNFGTAGFASLNGNVAYSYKVCNSKIVAWKQSTRSAWAVNPTTGALGNEVTPGMAAGGTVMEMQCIGNTVYVLIDNNAQSMTQIAKIDTSTTPFTVNIAEYANSDQMTGLFKTSDDKLWMAYYQGDGASEDGIIQLNTNLTLGTEPNSVDHFYNTNAYMQALQYLSDGSIHTWGRPEAGGGSIYFYKGSADAFLADATDDTLNGIQTYQLNGTVNHSTVISRAAKNQFATWAYISNAQIDYRVAYLQGSGGTPVDDEGFNGNSAVTLDWAPYNSNAGRDEVSLFTDENSFVFTYRDASGNLVIRTQTAKSDTP